MSKLNTDWMDLLSDPVQIDPADIPDIELYMDQITTFMNTRLSSSRRYPEDKILTRTMINNYTKNRLLPSSVKKRYSKEHIFMLIFIYHLKNMLSITDIQTLLDPISDTFFHRQGDSDLTLSEIYTRTTSLCAKRHPAIKEEILKAAELTRDSYSDFSLTEEESDYLEFFSLIYQLCYDIYVRKQMIERLIDNYRDSHSPRKEKKK